MTIPRITEECVMATVDKAIQTHPEIFAATTMLEMKKDQPALCAALTSLLKPFLDPSTPAADEMPVELAQEMILMASFCLVGVAVKSIKAQIEANEMNEAWS